MVWREEELRLWAIIPASMLVVLAIMFPLMLTLIHKIWMKMGAGLGWINTRILLCVGFYGILTPTGVLMRMAGKNSLRQGFDPNLQTYRVEPTGKHHTNLERQY